jgi:flagellar FliJ protein
VKRRTERMHKVFLLAETDAKQHCRAMGQSQRSLDDEIRRLEELKAYRLSYGLQCRQGQFNSSQLKDFQSFLKRLDQAVSIQARVVMEGRQKRDAHRSRWMTKQRKVESLERAVDRLQRQDTDVDERRQQKEADELSTRRGHFPTR